MGLTPRSPLIQNKNNHLLFYPLPVCYSVRKNFPLLTTPTLIWNPRDYHIKEVPRESEKWPFGAGSPGTESSSRCRQEAPGWWLSDETETSRARQEVSPEETACLSMQVSRHLGAVSGCDLVVEDKVPN